MSKEKKTDYPGIDYSCGNGSNTDTETGIRYGIISMNSLGEVFDEFKSTYIARCPHTGNELPKDFVTPDACPLCEDGHEIDDGEEYGDEPDSLSYEGDGIEAFVTSGNEVFVIKSPYYTHSQFCSPCVPGAGNLDVPCDEGPRTYCFPADWFYDNEAPYDYFEVSKDIAPEV